MKSSIKNTLSTLFLALFSLSAIAQYEIRMPSGATKPTYSVIGYNDWGSCQSDSTQTRTAICKNDLTGGVVDSAFCPGGDLVQSCVFLACNGEGLQSNFAYFSVAGSFVFQAPSEISSAKISIVGAGGGSRTKVGDGGLSGGGSGATIWRRSIDITSGETFNISVGEGGKGNGLNAVLGTSYATHGGPSSFGSHYASGGRANTSSWMGSGGSLPSGDNAYAGKNTPTAVSYSGANYYNNVTSLGRDFNESDGLFSSFGAAGGGAAGARNYGIDGIDGIVGIEWYGCPIGE